MPGTEVAVAPKKRKEKYQDVQKQGSLKEQVETKALLRVQAADRKYAHKFKSKGIELGVVLSCAVLIHPDTAARTSFGNLQLVTISSKSSPKGLTEQGKEAAQKKGVSVPKRTREVVVYVLFSDSVAKGHVMLPYSIRHFISADTHSCEFTDQILLPYTKSYPVLIYELWFQIEAFLNSHFASLLLHLLSCLLCNYLKWCLSVPGVYVKKYTANVKKDEPIMKMCPLHFSMHEKYVHDNSDLGSHEKDTWRNTSIPSENGIFFQKAPNNEHLLSADADSISESMSEQKVLIKHWLIGQLKEMAFHAENSEISSVVLPAKVLIHFEVVDGKLSRGVDFLYLLTITFENPGYNNLQGNAEITWKAPTDDLENLELNFGRLELGEALSFDSVVDDGFNNAFKLTRSSLGWMENAMSDVTKSIFFLH